MMDYQQRSKNFRTLVMKYFLTCSLFLLIKQGKVKCFFFVFLLFFFCFSFHELTLIP